MNLPIKPPLYEDRNQLGDDCMVCSQATDTVLGVQGDVFWVITFLTFLGIDEKAAFYWCGWMQGAPEGKVTGGTVEDVVVPICIACAAKAGIGEPPVLALPDAEIPTLVQPQEEWAERWAK